VEYNEDLYNTNNYNAGFILLALFESITSSDSQSKDDTTAIKAETIALADSLYKLFNAAPFITDSIATNDVLLNMPIKSLLDIVSVTDVKTIDFVKSLPETITLADVRAFVQSRSLQDFIVLIDTLTKQITDKRLSMESVRLQDWLRIDNAPSSDPWN